MDFAVTAPEQLGQTLRGLRRARGLSQDAVAHSTGLTQKTVSQLENRPETCSVATLMKYLAALGVAVALRERGGRASNSESW